MSTNALRFPASGGSSVASRPRTWVAAGAAAVLLVLLAGWMLVISPQHTATADLRASADQVEATGTALSARVTQLEQENASLPERQAELAALAAQMPSGADLPQLVRSLRAAATSAGVQLTVLTPSPVVAPVVTATPAPASGDAAAAPAGTQSTTSTTATSTTGAASDGGSSVLQLPLSITATGAYAGLERFLEAVQGQQRLVLVTGVSFTPSGASAGDLSLSISGTAFVMPATFASPSVASAPATPPVGAAAGAVQTN